MGGGNEKMEKIMMANVGISDSYRHVFLNRGMFVKAPPSFFEFYGSDFVKPHPKQMEEINKGNIKLRTMDHWRGKETVEVPVPAGTPVAEVVASNEQVVAPVVAEATPTIETPAPAPVVEAAPVAGPAEERSEPTVQKVKLRKSGRGRSVKIR